MKKSLFCACCFYIAFLMLGEGNGRPPTDPLPPGEGPPPYHQVLEEKVEEYKKLIYPILNKAQETLEKEPFSREGWTLEEVDLIRLCFTYSFDQQAFPSEVRLWMAEFIAKWNAQKAAE